MACEPTVNELVVTDATPEAFTVAVSVVPPANEKVTVPVGVPMAGAAAEMEALTVTACPVTDGFGTEVTVVVVFPWLTVCVPVAVLPAKFASPL
jgi:hypothetical protein